MPSTDAIRPDQQRELLVVATTAIRNALRTGNPWLPQLDHYSDPLFINYGASFVTLRIDEDLRGCIGTLEAYRPLLLDVASNAHAAAFRDPRFDPVRERELTHLDLHVSVLTAPRTMSFSSEDDLLQQIQPGIDGLVLEDIGHRGTFLPAVWRQVPQREQFWRELKRKAGLPSHYWSDTLTVSRYQTIEFGDTVAHLLK